MKKIVKNRNFQHAIVSFLLLQYCTVIYGQIDRDLLELPPCPQYNKTLEYFTKGDYEPIVDANNGRFKIQIDTTKCDTIIYKLYQTSKECNRLKKEAKDSYNAGDTTAAYLKYDTLFVLNPSDTDAQKYTDEHKQVKLRAELTNSINSFEDKLKNKEVCIATQNKNICQLKEDTTCLREHIKNLEAKLDSTYKENRITIGENTRREKLYLLINTEYEDYRKYKQRKENKTADSLLFNSVFSLCKNEKIDSALEQIKEDTLEAEQANYFRILKAQLYELNFDYEKAEGYYKNVDSLSRPEYDHAIPLIEFYYRYKKEKEAKQCYKEFKNEEKNTIPSKKEIFWRSRLKILESLNKFDKKFLCPLENKKNNVPDSIMMVAYITSGKLLLNEDSTYNQVKAEKYFRKAMSRSDTIRTDMLDKTMLLYYIGKSCEVSKQSKQLDSAYIFYSKALKWLDGNFSKYEPERAMIYRSLGNLLLKLKKSDSPTNEEAEGCFQKALNIYLQLADGINESKRYSTFWSDDVANLFNDLGRAQSLNAKYEKNVKYEKADSSFNKSLYYYRRLFADNPQMRKEEAKIIINQAINYEKNKDPGKQKKDIENRIRNALTILSECNILSNDNYVQVAVKVLNSIGKDLDSDSYSRRIFDTFNDLNSPTGGDTPEPIPSSYN